MSKRSVVVKKWDLANPIVHRMQKDPNHLYLHTSWPRPPPPVHPLLPLRPLPPVPPVPSLRPSLTSTFSYPNHFANFHHANHHPKTRNPSNWYHAGRPCQDNDDEPLRWTPSAGPARSFTEPHLHLPAVKNLTPSVAASIRQQAAGNAAGKSPHLTWPSRERRKSYVGWRRGWSVNMPRACRRAQNDVLGMPRARQLRRDPVQKNLTFLTYLTTIFKFS